MVYKSRKKLLLLRIWGPDQTSPMQQSGCGPRPLTECLSKWPHLVSSLRLPPAECSQPWDWASLGQSIWVLQSGASWSGPSRTALGVPFHAPTDQPGSHAAAKSKGEWLGGNPNTQKKDMVKLNILYCKPIAPKLY